MRVNSPLKLLSEQRQAAIANQDPSAKYCTFATLEEQRPSQVRMRTLVVREISSESCLLFVNRFSQKNLTNLSGLNAEALFFYPSLMSQFRMRGRLSLMKASALEEHWHNKPYESKLLDHYYARYQAQSTAICDRASLEDAMAQLRTIYPKPDEVPFIEDALGLLITADYLEVWQAHDSGIHDRSLFTKCASGWAKKVLVP